MEFLHDDPKVDVLPPYDVSPQGRRGSHILLAVLTIVLSWFFSHMMLALHYAHEFYDATEGRGLAFPGDEQAPD